MPERKIDISLPCRRQWGADFVQSPPEVWRRMVLARAFAGIAIASGALLLIIACAPGLPQLQWAQTEKGIVAGFLVAAILFVPFVVTFTRMGLNSDVGIFVPRLSPETKAKRARLSEACPIWKFLWYGWMVLIVIGWSGAGFFGLRINAFHVFSGAMSLLSGCWFAFVWPTARKLFPNPPPQDIERLGNKPRQMHVE